MLCNTASAQDYKLYAVLSNFNGEFCDASGNSSNHQSVPASDSPQEFRASVKGAFLHHLQGFNPGYLNNTGPDGVSFHSFLENDPQVQGMLRSLVDWVSIGQQPENIDWPDHNGIYFEESEAPGNFCAYYSKANQDDPCKCTEVCVTLKLSDLND